MRRPAQPYRPELTAARQWSRTAVGLRVLLFAAGAVALGVASGGRLTGLPGFTAVIGVLGLLAAVPRPRGSGAAVVLGAAAIGYAARYGTRPPPVAETLLLAAALAVHHQAAALAAALPPTCRVDRAVLARFGGHAVLVLALSAVVAVLALGLGRPGGSVPLELLGLVAAVLATAVPVLLGRARRPD